MQKSNDQPMEQARANVMKVIERAKTDTTFREHVIADPKAALSAAGVPADVVAKIVQASGGQHDLQGNCGLESTRSGTCWWTYTLW
ncbi:MAG: hypothetical protein NVSMB52_11250 [Chloroflexota bacterium]